MPLAGSRSAEEREQVSPPARRGMLVGAGLGLRTRRPLTGYQIKKRLSASVILSRPRS
jgi:hypothetical protein